MPFSTGLRMEKMIFVAGWYKSALLWGVRRGFTVGERGWVSNALNAAEI